jgi:hypothetical protein
VGRKSKLPQSITTKNTEQKAEYRLFFPIFANVVIFLTKQAKPNVIKIKNCKNSI